MTGIKDILKPTEDEKEESEQRIKEIERLLKKSEEYESSANRQLENAGGSYRSDHQKLWDGEQAIYTAIQSLQKQNKAIIELIKELYKRI
ncbi:hypothetical protein JW756_03870 [Candidatus Woesearchaeota archaeon]|nr:hypothetical protein [Candidatus Woesearchaeota archaeon]